MDNNTNTVNISLSEYNSLVSEANDYKNLLSKYEVELEILRDKKEDKILVVEREKGDRFGGSFTVEKLNLDINDPETSKKLLEIISKVDNSELSKTIKDKEDEIKSLRTKLNDTLDTLENAERSYKYSNRREEDAKKEEIRKLKKGYEDEILELEIDKETLVKALADLKKDKTQEQIELARQEELDELNEQIKALKIFKDNVQELNFFGFKRFVKNFENAKRWVLDNSWIEKTRYAVKSAVSRVEIFAELLKNVGKLPEKKREDKKNNCCNQHCSNLEWNGYTYVVSSVCQ